MSQPKLLITRPIQDARPLAELLEKRHYSCVLEPVLEVKLAEQSKEYLSSLQPEHAQAIILTSKNGARSLSLLMPHRNIPIIAVGRATAEVARDLGFRNISYAQGNVASLVEFIKERYRPQKGRIIYASATHTAFNLPHFLKREGYTVERIIAYEALAAKSLTNSTIEALQKGEVNGVLFFSRRSAEVFMALIKEHGLEESLAKLDAFCISSKITDILQPQLWHGIHSTDSSTLEPLYALLDSALTVR